MEFSIEPDFCLNVWFIVSKRHVRKLSTQLELASYINLVFVLGIWVNLARKENCISINIPNLNTHSLVWRFTLTSCFIIGCKQC
jgi:hypothetical protein